MANKRIMDVHIDQHFRAKVYTSGSAITGQVVVNSIRDTPFDNLEILLTGIAATRLDFIQQYPSFSFKTFMKIAMPLSDSDFPPDKVFRAGQEYRIPFHFVIPHQLTLGSCNHNCSSSAVREHHLRMPPTLGFWEADDQSPVMTRIEYAIKSRVTRNGPEETAFKLMEGYHVLKVLPAALEDSPLAITPRDERYKLSNTKTIRKALFSTKTGRVTASSSQPNAIMLSADGHKSSSSSVHVDLEYVPDSVETTPPKINSITGKIVSTTFFSAAPVNRFPDMGCRNDIHNTPCLNYITTNSLFTKPISQATWTRQDLTSLRRDSGYSSTVVDEDLSDDGAGDQGQRARGARNSKRARQSQLKYTTSLDVPFTVNNSNQKFFLPTFHSCLVSRTYVLQLSLSVGPTNTSISLFVPLQIGVEKMYEAQDSELPTFETVMAQGDGAEANDYLQPSSVSGRRDSLLQVGNLLPGYVEPRRRIVSVS